MAKFKDIDGNEYVIELDAPTIAAVRKECKFDLAQMDGKELQKIISDPCLLVNVLWVICRELELVPDNTAATQRKFARSLKGDALTLAVNAVLEATADFFPQKKKELLRAVAAETLTQEDLLVNRGLNKILDKDLVARMRKALETKMDRELEEHLTQYESASNSPASAGSDQTG